MGSVYKARQTDLERIVAIKVLHPGFITDVESRARFEREGRALSEMSHDNILFFYQFGFSNSVPYIAMEYLEGRSLRDIIDHEGKLDWQRAVEISISICKAIGSAHDRGIVHRDLKPGNVVLLNEPSPDFVKIVDFGLARALPGDLTIQHLTQTGQLVGSVYYMSPEQCRGQQADQRSDVYAVGCVLYEMLTGAPPIVADNPVGLMHKHVSETPLAPSLKLDRRLPRFVDLIVLKALAKDPSLRFQSMEEFVSALEAKSELGLDQPRTKRSSLHTAGVVFSLAVMLSLAVTLIVMLESGQLGSLFAGIKISRMPAADAARYRMAYAKDLQAQGKTEAAIRFLEAQDYNHTLEAIQCRLMLARMLEQSGRDSDALEQAQWALGFLANYCSSFKQRASPLFHELVGENLNLLQKYNQSTVFSYQDFRELHSHWYLKQQSKAIGISNLNERGVSPQLEQLKRFADRTVDQHLKLQLFEFELPALQRFPDPFFRAATYSMIAAYLLYVDRNRLREAVALRDQAFDIYTSHKMYCEALDVLAETCMSLAESPDGRDAYLQMTQKASQTMALLDSDGPVSLLETSIPARYRHNAISLGRIGHACLLAADSSASMKFVSAAYKMSLQCNRIAPFHQIYSDLVHLLCAQRRFEFASQIVDRAKAASADEVLLKLSTDTKLSVSGSVLGGFLDSLSGKILLSQRRFDEAFTQFHHALACYQSPNLQEGEEFNGYRATGIYECFDGILTCLALSHKNDELLRWTRAALKASPERSMLNPIRSSCIFNLIAAGLPAEANEQLELAINSCGKNAEGQAAACAFLTAAALSARLNDSVPEEERLLRRAALLTLDDATRLQLSLELIFCLLRRGHTEQAAAMITELPVNRLTPVQLTVKLYMVACLELQQRDLAALRRTMDEIDKVGIHSSYALEYFLRTMLDPSPATLDAVIASLKETLDCHPLHGRIQVLNIKQLAEQLNKRTPEVKGLRKFIEALNNLLTLDRR